MARDYIEEAREIARLLEEEGLNAEASAVLEAIDMGATGTEILMALKWNLEHIAQATAGTHLRIQNRVRDLCSAISDALGT